MNDQETQVNTAVEQTQLESQLLNLNAAVNTLEEVLDPILVPERPEERCDSPVDEAHSRLYTILALTIDRLLALRARLDI